MKRKARKDFAFSDGTVIPAGTQVAVVSWCAHLDEVNVRFIVREVLLTGLLQKNYEDPLEFKPWRFSERRKQEGEGIRHQMTTTSLDFIFFGHGRSAWCVHPVKFYDFSESEICLQSGPLLCRQRDESLDVLRSHEF